MRITLPLDDDVAARLKRLVRLRRQPPGAVLNDVMRVGLTELEKPPGRVPFRTAGFDLGTSLIASLDDVEGVLARIDGDRHR